ncbi:metallophosphoesterase family protein [Paenibacillaceae sp. P-4]|uniref:metallophosphoesterase family protein n=1 Tax=Paenibacillaceae bacterium P-4 TaxID=3160969 RepID=UPI0032E80CD8
MIAIISDIHGNYPALKSVLEDIDRQECTQIISLGDIAGYYCMINECIEALRERQVTNILGNHDNYLVNNVDCSRSNSVNRCIKYQSKVIAAHNHEWLSKSLFEYIDDETYMVHGGWKDKQEEYLYNLSEDYFSGMNFTYFISGHTHVQSLFKFSGKVYCNPGSVGQPRDGDSRAAYVLFNGQQFDLRRVEYDIDWIAKEMDRNGFEEYFYQNLYHGKRLDGKVSTFNITG